jgi:glycosyltransferase involved in cell wall biosynthesis
VTKQLITAVTNCQGVGPDGRRLRVLVIADSCNPEWESIPLVGWSHYEALSRVVDTHLITRNYNRPALDRAGLVEGRDYTAFDTDWLVNPVARLVERISGPNKGYAMLTALTMPAYLMTEQMMWRRFRRALRAGEFDLVHRITPLSAAVPSLLAARCRRIGVPFVLGPLNGGLPWPKEFPELQRQEGEFLSRLRGLYRLVPGYRATRRAAAAIMVGGASAMADLPEKWRSKAVYVPENGIDPARFPRPALRSAEGYTNRPLRAAFLGRMVPYKGCDMLLEAAAPLLRSGRLVLDIIGFGPERERLDGMVAELGLGQSVTFAGKLSHFDLAPRLNRADLLTFPSVHEFGGAVVLEAMAAGVVPVVVNYGGPAELVSPASGYLLPLGDRAALIASLRATLEAILADPAQLAAKSRTGVDRAFGLFAWPAKARQTLEVYRWVLGQRADKPDMGLPFLDPAPVAQNEAAPQPELVA